MFTWIKYWWQQFILVSILVLLTIQPSFAIVVSDVPRPPADSYIVDLADLLDTATEVEINREIATIEKQKGKTIYVVTVPEVTVAKAKAEFKIVPPISSSRRFLESLLLNWNLEQLNQDNAMLMLVSKADHSIEIRSGSNLKYIIRDRHIQGLIDKIIIPQFKHYDFSQGILLGITELVRKISNPQYDWLPNKMKVTWESKQQERCVSRNFLNLEELDSSYSCFSQASYYGGSGKW